MFRFICIGFVLFDLFSLFNLSLAKNCDCKCNPPLKTIFQVVQHFKEVQSCNRIFTSNYGISVDGVRDISYKGVLNSGETASSLCQCIYDYLNQRDWLKGSKGSCCDKNGFAILTLKGQPDPKFNETILDEPLDLLKATFNQFPYAELEKHECRPTTSTDKNGCVHFKVKCVLYPDSPCKQDLCDSILVYLNQDHWLGKLTSTCTTKGNNLYMDVHSATENKCKNAKKN